LLSTEVLTLLRGLTHPMLIVGASWSTALVFAGTYDCWLISLCVCVCWGEGVLKPPWFY